MQICGRFACPRKAVGMAPTMDFNNCRGRLRARRRLAAKLSSMRHLSLLSLLLTLTWDGPPARAQGPLATLKGHRNTISCVAFAPDGKTLASGAKDGAVIVWDLATHKPLKNF